MDGVTTSWLLRQRTTLLIRLYNNGFTNATFSHALQDILIERHGHIFFQRDSLLNLIGRDFESIVHVLLRSCGSRDDHLPIQRLIDFINGSLPKVLMPFLDDESDESALYCVSAPSAPSCQGYDPIAPTTSIQNELAEVSHCTPIKNDIVWKKHETVIQERIVEYVSIDENGNRHRVLETDKTQKDTIHIETALGVFAHREYTQQEQTEDMDDEQVTFKRATEEYIHFKREDDEYEYLHSEIPPSSPEKYTINEDDCSIEHQNDCNYDDDRVSCSDQEDESSNSSSTHI